VEISRDSTYQLKVAGQLAVRFDTNVHEIKLIENYTPQKDIYTQVNSDGQTKYDAQGNPISSIVDSNTWNGVGVVSEVQTLKISGTATAQVSFLGTLIPDGPGSLGASAIGDTAVQTAAKIADEASAGPGTSVIIDNWNKANPDREILSITQVGTTAELQITYKNTEGEVKYLPSASSMGINFGQSVETTKGRADSVTYVLNNEIELKVSYGDILVDDAGNQIDLDSDGNLAGDDAVTENNIIKALVYKINQSQDIGGSVQAYNGQYELAEDGSKILTSDPRHSDYDASDPYKDRYLVVESTVPGEKGKFVGKVVVNDDDGGIPASVKSSIQINKNDSKIGIDDIHLEIFEQEINVTGGSLSPIINNIKTDSGSNLFTEYKEKLDQLAKMISDMSNSYIENSDESYVFGTSAVELHADSDHRVDINLFTGSTVKSLTFNESMVNTLSQEKLDYLAQIQWKDDFDFDGTGENNSSFAQFYQETRVKIADDRENIIFKEESQSAVKESMQTAYDKLTKVDKDAEMIELIKFQSAYEANAKIITVLDEMLTTLLNLKR
jgi:flagellar hook-associated protein FlgK